VRLRPWALLLAATLAARCDQAEIPAVKPPELPKQATWKPATPNVLPLQWSASILVTGGFVSRIQGFAAFSNQPTCSPQLRLDLERALADAKPEQWHGPYRGDGPLKISDQFTYQLTVTIDNVNRITSWQADGADKLPADARKVYEALDRLWTECGKKRAG
jgi:hypothetical protein